MAVSESERLSEGIRAPDLGVPIRPARQRKIIHIDMDAFYASVEQRDNPELRGKPVAVGGSRERGVVAAASYEARKFGVHSAMPSVTARRKCPELIFVIAAIRRLQERCPDQIREIFAEYTPLIEPLSLDEAYLDVTENSKQIASATEIAEQIRARIRAETGLTASAGVSYNKFLAKMASERAQARRAVRHHAQDGRGLRRKPAGRQVSRDWSGDKRQDGAARHPRRRRS